MQVLPACLAVLRGRVVTLDEIAKRLFERNCAHYGFDQASLDSEWDEDPLLREFWIVQVQSVRADLKLLA